MVLADFGSSRLIASASPARCNVGTLWYMAPEIVFGSRHYSPKVDVFGVGCIAGELLRNKPLFAGSSQLDQICKLVETLGTPDESTWPELGSLSDWSLLEFAPRAPQAREHLFPSTEGYPWEAGTDALIRLIVDKMLVYNPERRSSAAELARSAAAASTQMSEGLIKAAPSFHEAALSLADHGASFTSPPDY